MPERDKETSGIDLPEFTQRFITDFRKSIAQQQRVAKVISEVIAATKPGELILSENDSVPLQQKVVNVLAKVKQAIGKLGFDTLNTPPNLRSIINSIKVYGTLAGVIVDPEISEIMVNGKDSIYVERSGKLYKTGLRFESSEDIVFVMREMLKPLGRTISPTYPMVDARLQDGSRLNCIIPPLSVSGPMVTIRKFKADVISVEDLVLRGTLVAPMAKLLQIAVTAKRNVVVCGGTGSGKTTLLNILGTFIPQEERVITLEDAAELRLPHKHLGRLETRPKDLSDTPEVTMRDLVRNCLRMRPDRIIVGEVRGEEVLDMFQAMNTGHEGSMTTVHANSPRDLLTRIEMMLNLASGNIPQQTAKQLIASSIHLIVCVQRFSDGTRKIVAINEVTGMEGPTISMAPLFQFRRTGIGADGSIEGEFESTGFRPRFFETLEGMGITIPPDLLL